MIMINLQDAVAFGHAPLLRNELMQLGLAEMLRLKKKFWLMTVL